jgi:hypothetical protein
VIFKNVVLSVIFGVFFGLEKRLDNRIMFFCALIVSFKYFSDFLMPRCSREHILAIGVFHLTINTRIL